jgi:hypothetical protein
MSIHKKISEIMKKVAFVKKDSTIGYGNNAYKAVSHDAVLRMIREHLIDVGVIVIPSQVEKGVSVPGTTKNGGAKIRFEAMYDVMFYDSDSDTSLTIRTEAHADDSGDKAANKAITYATKNALLKAFMLETGEDETGEASKNTITVKQATLLQGLVTETKSDEEKFLTTFGVEKYADISVDHFSKALTMLQTKLKKAS